MWPGPPPKSAPVPSGAARPKTGTYALAKEPRHGLRGQPDPQSEGGLTHRWLVALDESRVGVDGHLPMRQAHECVAPPRGGGRAMKRGGPGAPTSDGPRNAVASAHAIAKGNDK
eukprot:10080237-Alexandrium_andersonii.AAC.1